MTSAPKASTLTDPADPTDPTGSTDRAGIDARAGLQAVLWDFDGTLADSEHLWIESEYEVIGELGGTWSDEHAKHLVGNALIDSGRYIVKTIGREGDVDPGWLMDQLTARVTAKLESGTIPWRPGALELLADLNAAGVRCALVSASYRTMLDAVVRRLPEGSFDSVVAGDEVRVGKPDPEPYLKAARQLGVDPARCVVLEDSNPGSASGNAAGALVLAIHNMVEISAAPRRIHLTTLEGLDTARLATLLVEHPPEPAS